ncbi:MAG: radical SAM protein [Coriobacteriales bacterium]|jgi:putative pyruvate formate lyase activating enzyme
MASFASGRPELGASSDNLAATPAGTTQVPASEATPRPRRPFDGPQGREPCWLWRWESPCQLCPRRCGALRADGARGACGATGELRVARAALHFWEEPPISGESGSGAIFFSNCPMRCGFCQNGTISAGGFGLPIDVDRLAQIMLELRDQGANNINLVTATHYAPQVIDAVMLARDRGMGLPVVYNTSAYERPEVVDALAGVVDVWLPDCKYASPRLAGELSHAADYPSVALDAIGRMVAATEDRGGRLVGGEQGIMRRGVIVRHLVLPGHADDSMRVLRELWDRFGNDIDVSVMNQYTPIVGPQGLPGHPELGRAVLDDEYELVLDYADDLGFENLWWQQGGTVEESFIPDFDATGVLGPADGGEHR